MNIPWRMDFEGASSWFGRSITRVPGGTTSVVFGADGRFDGLLRRYPGHIKYPDSTKALHTSLGVYNEANTFDIIRVEPFSILKEIGSTVKIKGFVVQNSSASLEVWYRFSDDTSGVLRKLDLGTIFSGPHVLTGEDTSDFVTLPPLVDLDEETAGTATAGCRFDDGQGDSLVVGVKDIALAGSVRVGISSYRVMQGRDGRWEPIGGYFNGQIKALCVYQNELYAGGEFTEMDGNECKRFAVYRGGAWQEVEGGFPNGAVNALLVFENDPLRGEDILMIGGSWQNMPNNGTASTTITETNAYLRPDGSLYLQDGGELSEILGFCVDPTTNNLFAYGVSKNAGDYPVHRYLSGSGFFEPTATGLATTGLPTSTSAGSLVGVAMCANQTNGNVYLMTQERTAGDYDLKQLGIADPSTGTWSAIRTETLADGVDVQGTLLWCDTGMYFITDSPTWASIDTVRMRWVSGTTWEDVASDRTLAVDEYGGGWTDGTSAHTYFWGQLQANDEASFGVSEDALFSIAYSGRYLYIFSTEANHKVLSWDTIDDDFKVETLGSLVADLPAPEFTIVSDSGVDNYIAGRYAAAYRYIDRRRGRYSELSPIVGALDSAVDGDYGFMQVTPLSKEVTLNGVQIFQSLSSLDDAINAGGSLWLAAEGSHDGYGGFEASIGRNGDGPPDSPIMGYLRDEDLISDPQFSYSFIRETVRDMGKCYASIHFQGMTFCVEARDGYVQLRWSPAWRWEPENFPAINEFRLEIPEEAAKTCRFTVAGDRLFLTGGSHIYWIQRVGELVGAVPLFNDHKILSRDSVARVGNMLYVGTDGGLVEINPGDGSARVMPDLSLLFLDRWQRALVPGDDDYHVSMAYDAKMRCLYIHNAFLDETICVWADSGRVTILPFHRCQICVTAADLDTESTRAYFLSKNRRIHYPNWNEEDDAPFTMGGKMFGTKGGPYPYNLTATVTDSTTLTFVGTPFTISSSDSDLLPLAGLYVAILTGSDAGTIVPITSLTANTLVFSGASFTDVGDEVQVALAPACFGFYSSNLWGPSGRSDSFSRKGVTSIALSVDRVQAGHTLAGIPEVEATVGAFRASAWDAVNPRLTASDAFVAFAGGGADIEGPLSEDQPTANTAVPPVADGATLFFGALILSSDRMMDILEAAAEGWIEPTGIAGLNT